MADKARPQVIAIEEHYMDPEVDAKMGGRVGGGEETRKRLADLGELRLKEMDQAGIDIQVLSHCPPKSARRLRVSAPPPTRPPSLASTSGSR